MPFRSRKGRRHVLRVIRDILFYTPRLRGTNLNGALEFVNRVLPHRSVVVIISDFFVEPSELRGCFQHLRFRKHDVALFHLLDPQEIDFDFRRPMRFIDLEGGPAIFAEPNDIADRYHQAMKTYLEDIRQVALESGLDYQPIKINEDYEQVLMRFLVGRADRKSTRLNSSHMSESRMPSSA